VPLPEDAAHDPSTVAYDRQLVPWLFEHWAETFIDVAAPSSSSRLVDLACGSGLVTRHLVGRLDRDGRIDALDIDPAMLAYASSTIDDDRIRWHVADAANLPLADDSIDGALCHQGLQFFPDQPGVLAEIARTLRSGGQLTVAVWGRLEGNPWPAALADATRTVLGDDVAAGMTTVCALGDPTRLATLLDTGGFERVTVQTHERTAHHLDVRAAVAGQLDALPSGSMADQLSDGQRTELEAAMIARLAPHTDPNGKLAVPSTSVLASAIVT
jgi:SAM-dependent methyltransferase